jgi:hypothetical protein
MRRTTLLSAALLMFPLTISAQSHALVGSWSVRYPAGIRHENGVATPITGTGTFAVVQQGDSLVATLTPNPVEGQPTRPPVRMASVATAGEVTFVTRGTATLNMGGESRQATSVSTYVLRANGDTLEGTIERRLEGVDDLPLAPQPAQPVTGTRIKA